MRFFFGSISAWFSSTINTYILFSLTNSETTVICGAPISFKRPSVGREHKGEAASSMKLKRFLLRYYPPGVILEYELRDKTRELKEIDLLHLTAE